MSEETDAWVWATFRECFRPCGKDQQPESDKMQCRCATLNPAHYARIKEEVLPTLKAADADKGSLLNPSKVAGILARYGERTKTSAINDRVCTKKGFRHKTISGGSAVFGVVRCGEGHPTPSSAAVRAAPSGAAGSADPPAADPMAVAPVRPAVRACLRHHPALSFASPPPPPCPPCPPPPYW